MTVRRLRYFGHRRRGSCSVLLTLMLLLMGVAPPAVAIDLTGVTDADIEGHSIAYGFGPGGTGALSLVARELGLAEHNHAVMGGTLFRGYGGDDWVEILSHTPRTEAVAPYSRRPRLALIMHGGNDIVSGDGFGPEFRQLLRTVVSRQRSSAVYEETDPSVHYTYPAWSYLNGPGQSGAGLLGTQTDGARLTIQVAPGRVPAGGTLALGLYAVPTLGAFHLVYVDGVVHGGIETRGVAAAGRPVGVVYRIRDLGPGAHTITVVPTGTATSTYFDYWQVEPPDPQPVVLVKQYRLPGGESHGRSDARVLELNAIQDSVASEFDGQVITVDTDSVINKSAPLLSDGVHPTQAGHYALARAILDRLGYPGRFTPPAPDPVAEDDPGPPAEEDPAPSPQGDPIGGRMSAMARIRRGPRERTAQRSPEFRFGPRDRGLDYFCRVDDQPFAPCANPSEFPRLRLGKHRFVLRAIDTVTGRNQVLFHRWRIVRR